MDDEGVAGEDDLGVVGRQARIGVACIHRLREQVTASAGRSCDPDREVVRKVALPGLRQRVAPQRPGRVGDVAAVVGNRERLERVQVAPASAPALRTGKRGQLAGGDVDAFDQTLVGDAVHDLSGTGEQQAGDAVVCHSARPPRSAGGRDQHYLAIVRIGDVPSIRRPGREVTHDRRRLRPRYTHATRTSRRAQDRYCRDHSNTYREPTHRHLYRLANDHAKAPRTHLYTVGRMETAEPPPSHRDHPTIPRARLPRPGPVAQRIERQTSNLRAEVRFLPGPSRRTDTRARAR